MIPSARLLGRLLLVAGPGAFVACGARSEPLETTPPTDVSSAGAAGAGQSGNGQSAGQGGSAQAGQGGGAQAGQGGSAQAGTAGQGGSAQAGQGGVAGQTLCYQVPAGDPPPPDPCLPLDSTILIGTLSQPSPPQCATVSQVLSGPTEQLNGGQLTCCYQCITQQQPCGTGRPLLIDAQPRLARLVRSSDRAQSWGA
jgi:hypothetical protein